MEIIIKKHPNFPSAPQESLLVLNFFSHLLMRLSLWYCLTAPSHTSLHSPYCLAAQLSSHSGLSGDVPGGLSWSSLCCPFKPFQLVIYLSLCLLFLSSVLSYHFSVSASLHWFFFCCCCCDCFPVPLSPSVISLRSSGP